MQNEVPGVWVCAYLCVRVCVCVCVCIFCVDCALAFTAVPGYHENTSVSVAQAAQAAEPVTYDYTYHPLPRAQEAGERRVGRERKREGARSEGESGKERRGRRTGGGWRKRTCTWL